MRQAQRAPPLLDPNAGLPAPGNKVTECLASARMVGRLDCTGGIAPLLPQFLPERGSVWKDGAERGWSNCFRKGPFNPGKGPYPPRRWRNTLQRPSANSLQPQSPVFTCSSVTHTPIHKMAKSGATLALAGMGARASVLTAPSVCSCLHPPGCEGVTLPVSNMGTIFSSHSVPRSPDCASPSGEVLPTRGRAGRGAPGGVAGPPLRGRTLHTPPGRHPN